ncbi:MAG: hypothetical protein Q7S03_03410 [bacterium]|nr:hypothetical protein [bacterium]
MQASFDLGYGLVVRLVAPDEAKDRRGRPVWKLLIKGAADETMETEGLLFSQGISGEALVSTVRNDLYRLVSSSLIDAKVAKIEEFVKALYKKYRGSQT